MMCSSTDGLTGESPLAGNLGEVTELAERFAHLEQQAEPVVAERGVVGHHEHVLEEARERRAELRAARTTSTGTWSRLSNRSSPKWRASPRSSRVIASPPSSASRSSPIAARRSPNGSREPVGLCPRANATVRLSILSAAERIF